MVLGPTESPLSLVTSSKKLTMEYKHLLTALSIFTLPILLLWLRVIPYNLRKYVHYLSFGAISLLALDFFPNLYSLGLRTDNLAASLIPYIKVTLILLILIIFLSRIYRTTGVKNPFKYMHFRYGFFLVSAAQELAYRGILIPILLSTDMSFINVIIIDSVLFSFLHIIYPHPLRNIIYSFLAGIIYATLYIFYPNLILIIISHSIVNFTALYFQLIGPKITTKLSSQ